jgi:hypothetical protein
MVPLYWRITVDDQEACFGMKRGLNLKNRKATPEITCFHRSLTVFSGWLMYYRSKNLMMKPCLSKGSGRKNEREISIKNATAENVFSSNLNGAALAESKLLL